jgi:hypothetical protein
MLYVDGKLKFGQPWVDLHSTLGLFLPGLSFATTTITWEGKGNAGEYQNRWTESNILADTIGTQAGIVPKIIVSTRGKDKENEAKTLLALMLGFGIMNIVDQGLVYEPFFEKAWNIVYDFGWGDKDVNIYPFWGKEKQPVTHNGKNVRMTVVTRPPDRLHRTLLMIGNLGDAEKITLDASGLGLFKYTFKDAETYERYSSSGPKCEVEIPKRGYKLIYVWGTK